MSILAAAGMLDWVYDNPDWLVGSVIVGAVVAFSLGGVILVHRHVESAVRQQHNDLTGFACTIIGTVAAVLLAFVSVSSWETFTRDKDIADSESTAIANLYSTTTSIVADDVRASIQGHLRDYTRMVIDDEWPKQRQGYLAQSDLIPGRTELRSINRELVAMKPQTIGDGNVQMVLMTSLNQLLATRHQRVIAVDEHVDGAVWGVILAGTALAIASTWLFGPRSLTMHMVLTGSVAASLALVIVLIVTTDYPFRGSVSIGSGPYEECLLAMQPVPPG